jgi:hypothetical protein
LGENQYSSWNLSRLCFQNLKPHYGPGVDSASN